jgi:Ser/Thr protein kinase RdoA (MazF antagonist)
VGVDREAETPLEGGWLTSGVVRVGDTVRRPPSANGAFVHRLLEQLEQVGFDASPRFLGVDGQGREILTFIDGDVPSDCRSAIWTDEQLSAVARLLRRLHDATASTTLTSGAEVVCHNDFGPWNLVWREGIPVGIIDFDNAAPGRRLDDLGYSVWKHLNLGLVELRVGEQRRRAGLMASAYGLPADRHLLAAIERSQMRMREVIGSAPNDPKRDEALGQNQRERDWLSSNGMLLFG